MREGWRCVPLREVISLDVDRVKAEADERYSFAGVYSFGRGLFHRDAIRGSETSYAYLHQLHEGQLVMSRLFGWEGALAPVPREFDGCVLSPEFPTFRPDPSLLIDYLALLVQEPTLWESLRRRAVGLGSRRARVKAEVLLDTEVLVPSLDDQRRIVDLARSFDQFLDATAAVEREANSAATALARRLLEAGHPYLPLGDVVELTLGRQVAHERRAGDRVLPYLRAANVQDGFVRVDDVKQMPFSPDEIERYRLRFGDVLVQEGGTPPGTTAPWRAEIDGDVGFQNSVIRARAIDGVTTAQFVEVLCRWCHETGRFAAQGRRTHGIAHLGLARASSILVPVPSLSDQKHLCGIVASTRAVADTAGAQRRKAAEARATIVTSLLAGRHAIEAAYDEIAAATGEAAA